MNIFELNKRLSKLTLNESQLFPENEPDFRICKTDPLPQYENGKATEKIIGQRATIVVPNMGYDKFTVKLICDKPIITNEQIQQKGGLVKVKLINLTGKIYRKSEDVYEFSYSADGMEVL